MPHGRGLAGCVLAACVLLALGVVATARAASPWSGSGSGSTSVTNDGSIGTQSSFTYTVNPGSFGNWRFSTVAGTDGDVVLSYTYSGYHAYYRVSVSLSAFVTHGAATTTHPLVAAGPANCCAAPSGGFTYSGTVTLSLQAGDTYGFDMAGSHSDSDRRLLGTLTVTDLTRAPERVGYCSAPGNSDPASGMPIPASTFLDLAPHQPSSDPHYQSAAPAIFVEGHGITCDRPPAGYESSGYAGNAQNVSPGIYRYFTAP